MCVFVQRRVPDLTKTPIDDLEKLMPNSFWLFTQMQADSVRFVKHYKIFLIYYQFIHNTQAFADKLATSTFISTEEKFNQNVLE